ncbi:helix-turn-helix transcriptional regulator [Candidatus Regiella endosymbiont of Tuberolachnus salignus]|uniref:helix-turn-helix transcriptional regulator n=1 Tax=Candidatus Regiella endosymbiont of Tuberolachnus salignus TaxID=3077956 RepID=UPI0030D45A29
MRIFDLTNVSEFHQVFPELTQAQFETAMLFCLGLSQGEIAHLRSVSYSTIKQTLEDIKVKLDFYSINNLLAVFQIRLFIFVLTRCTIEHRTK